MKGRAKFIYYDAFKLSGKFMRDEFDVVFSQGFLNILTTKKLIPSLKSNLK